MLLGMVVMFYIMSLDIEPYKMGTYVFLWGTLTMTLTTESTRRFLIDPFQNKIYTRFEKKVIMESYLAGLKVASRPFINFTPRSIIEFFANASFIPVIGWLFFDIRLEYVIGAEVAALMLNKVYGYLRYTPVLKAILAEAKKAVQIDEEESEKQEE